MNRLARKHAAVDSSEIFQSLRVAYKAGLLQSYMCIADEALQSVMKELGLGSFELIDHIDRSDPTPAEARLVRLGPWLRWISTPWLMSVLARLLKFPAVRRWLIGAIRKRFRDEFAGSADGPWTMGGAP
jgi:hypothetical protein